MIRALMFVLASLVILPRVQAAEPKLQEKYAEVFSKVEHLTVDFSQTTYKKLRDRSTTRTGTASFSKPGMFRWNFTGDKAGLEEYYFNGEKLTHFQEKSKLVNHYNTNASLARELQEVVNLVLDPKALLNRYQVKEIKTEGGRTQAVLIPQQRESTDVDTIFVKVSDVKKFVEEVQIFYIDGNNTQFTFKNPVQKANDPKIFTFSRQGNFTVRHHG